MLSNNEKRFLRSPKSLESKSRRYIKHQLNNKLDSVAKDLAFMLEKGYDISRIVNVLLAASDEKTKKSAEILNKILQLQQQLQQPLEHDDSKVIEYTPIEPTETIDQSESDWDA